MTKNNIALIGMAGVGKSYIGRHLADKLGWSLIDTDDILESQNDADIGNLPNIIGDEAFIQLEQQVIIDVAKKSNTVISTGGSVIYSPKAMKALSKTSFIVYLEDDVEEIISRFTNTRDESFTLIMQKNKSLRELFEERESLYKKYAECTHRRNRESTAEEEIKNIIKICNIPFPTQ